MVLNLSLYGIFHLTLAGQRQVETEILFGVFSCSDPSVMLNVFNERTSFAYLLLAAIHDLS